MGDNYHQQGDIDNSDFSFGETTDSDFRFWVNEKWFEYREECLAWEGKMPKGSPKDYFNKYKWFLKEKYKQENKL